jgi:hypothetical protein
MTESWSKTSLGLPIVFLYFSKRMVLIWLAHFRIQIVMYRSTARQRISKQAFSTVERLCSLRGPCRVVIKGQRRSFDFLARSWENSVEEEFIWVSCCRELGRVLDMAVQGYWEEMARKELGREKKTSCVIWSDSETVINPLPGYE